MAIKQTIAVEGRSVDIIQRNEQDYISLTDIAKHVNTYAIKERIIPAEITAHRSPAFKPAPEFLADVKE